MITLAETIRQQLNYQGRAIPWSWGMHALRALPEAKTGSDGYAIEDDDDFKMGGLQFKVQGTKFKGHVRIILDYGDTYIVRFGHLRKRFKVIKEYEGVYNDMLTDLVDRYVET